MAEEQSKPRPWLRRLRIALMILGPLALLAGGLTYYLTHRGYVSTEDAFVEANIIKISPRVAGRVVAVPVEDNEHVGKGVVLLKLDPSTYQAMVDAAQARLGSVRAQVASLKAKYQALDAQVASAQSQVAYLTREVKRNGPLAQKNVITNARLDALNTQLTRARQQVTVLKAQGQQVLAQLGGNPNQPVEQNPDYLQAAAQLKEAQLNLADTVVRAPAAGVVGHVGVRPGDTLSVGQPAFPLVETADMWIKANFKETSLTNLQPGQSVTINVDSYPDHTWKGKVGSVSPGSGQIFSLLPPQNSSGNWVKVTQRIPVRITIDNPGSGPILRAGMSAEVSVYVGGH
ncbi:MAG: HlyD family secretion protein [Gammaproteobacteria bacterium]